MVGKTDCRIFLCVVDDSDELETALHYAAKRAKSTHGKVALFYCIEPQEFQHWIGVGRIMEKEAEEDAKIYLRNAAAYVKTITNEEPIEYLKRGKVVDTLMDLLLDQKEGISTLVLAAGSSKKEGPGPLITHFISKQAYQMPVPITVVPHHLSKEEIDKVTEL